MNKLMLSLLCATSMVMAAANVSAAEPAAPMPPAPMADGEMLPPPPPPADEDMRPLPPSHEKARKEMQDRIKEHDERLAKELGLTEEQQKQAEAVRTQGRERMEPLMKQMKEIRQQMDEVRKQNMEDFEEILTPEQKTQFEKIKADNKKKMEKKFAKKHKKDKKHRKDRKDKED